MNIAEYQKQIIELAKQVTDEKVIKRLWMSLKIAVSQQPESESD